MFRYRLQLRRWAARVLLLWLLGLGVGVAHACLTPSALMPAATHFGHHAAHEVGDGAGQASQQQKANCQDFCAKARVSIPPQKVATDGAQGLSLPAAMVAVVLPLPQFEPVLPWVPRREDWPPLPVATTFVRLAL